MTGMTTSTSPGIAQRTPSFASGAPRNGLLKKKAQEVAAAGRGGDTELAHVNPREKAMLKRAGGSGSHNPKTGLREFMNEGGGGTGDGSGENDHDVGGGEKDAAGDRDVGTAATAPQGTVEDAEQATAEDEAAGTSKSSPAWIDSMRAYVSWAKENPMGAVAFSAFAGMAPGATMGKAAAGYANAHGIAMDMPSVGPAGVGGADPAGGAPGTAGASAATGASAANNYAGTTAGVPNGLVGQSPGNPTPETHPNGAYQVNQNTGMVEWTPER